MPKLCVLGKWSPRYFHGFSRIFHTRPFSLVPGKSREGSGHRAEKAAGFFPWPNLGTRAFTYVGWVRKPKANRITRAINTPPRVWPQEKGFTLKHKENGLAGFCPSLGDQSLSTENWGPAVVKWFGRRQKPGIPREGREWMSRKGQSGPFRMSSIGSWANRPVGRGHGTDIGVKDGSGKHVGLVQVFLPGTTQLLINLTHSQNTIEHALQHAAVHGDHRIPER